MPDLSTPKRIDSDIMGHPNEHLTRRTHGLYLWRELRDDPKPGPPNSSTRSGVHIPARAVFTFGGAGCGFICGKLPAHQKHQHTERAETTGRNGGSLGRARPANAWLDLNPSASVKKPGQRLTPDDPVPDQPMPFGSEPQYPDTTQPGRSGVEGGGLGV
jgi:hypothetical protein